MTGLQRYLSFVGGCYSYTLLILILHYHAGTLQRCNGAVHTDVPAASSLDSNIIRASSALLEFKAGITSDPGSLLASWINGSNPCNQSRPWQGVSCDAAGRNVAKLRLGGGGLSGAMISATALATLCGGGLSVLNLSNNSLSGSLPPSLGACSSLRKLDLSSNHLSGPLPPSAFSNLSSLRFLDFSHNTFSGSLPPQIWHLPALRILYLLSPAGQNPMQASDIPEVLPFCANLTHLELEAVSFNNSAGNHLTTSLSQCTRLQVLVLDETGLAGTIAEDFWQLPSLTSLELISSPGDQLAAASLPASMASCPSLVILWLENVILAGATLPPSLGNCKNLQFLGFYQTGVQGLVPRSVWELPELVDLRLFEPNLASEVSLPQHLPSCATIQVIEIQGVKISGQIPPSIGNCSGLQVLTLSEVGLTGPLPKSLGNLAKLEYLQLEGNSLRGPLPSSLSQCSQLSRVRLGGNPLTGTIPKGFGNLSQLQHLSLYDCGLTGPIPSELGNCSELQWLDLGWNSISSGIPQSFANLHNLQTLSWNGSPLSRGVIPEFVTANLSGQLVELDLEACQIAQFPVGLGRLSQLQVLNLGVNRIEGPISSLMDLGRLSQLTFLNLGTNKLAGSLSQQFIQALSNCTHLAQLFLDNNNLSGSLPDHNSLMDLGRLSQLTILNLGTNKLAGSLSQQFIHALSNCTHLAQLFLDNNHLSGSLPHNIGDMQSLQVLYINDNMLSGSIPASIGNLSLINDLNMGNNRLEGQIPSSFGRLVGLNKNLILSGNTLTGSIPEELGSLSQLEVLDLSKNNLSGDVPGAALLNCTSLERLRLHENSLTGALDKMELWKMSRLTIFTAQQNQLHGKVTSNLTSSNSLELVNLGTNNLSRALPSEKVSDGLEKLRVLILSNNTFSGAIPNWVWELPNLQVLDLSNSSLTGAMPTSMAHLEYFKRNGNQPINASKTLYEEVPLPNHYTPQIMSYLLNTRIVLDISRNSIHGTIPSSIGELVGLTWLDLSHNLLVGCIPASLGSISRLDFLDLSSNSLQCTIPFELGFLGFLGSLNLSNNELVGPIPTTNDFNTRYGPSSFQGNVGLCGNPLPNLCNATNTTNNTTNLDGSMSSSWFDNNFSLGGIILGYILGFSGFLGFLLLRKTTIKHNMRVKHVHRSQRTSSFGS